MILLFRGVLVDHRVVDLKVPTINVESFFENLLWKDQPISILGSHWLTEARLSLYRYAVVAKPVIQIPWFNFWNLWSVLNNPFPCILHICHEKIRH